MSTQMTIELSAEKPRKHEFYRATLDLPATELQIEDALSKARFQNESSKKYIDIEEAILFDPSHLSVTADDIHMGYDTSGGKCWHGLRAGQIRR